jgi:hypothetical protein
MTHLQRRLKKLEAVLTDPMGLVPHTPKWLEYWDRQYFLFLTGQVRTAIWLSSIAAYRAVMKYANGSRSSLTGRALCKDDPYRARTE